MRHLALMIVAALLGLAALPSSVAARQAQSPPPEQWTIITCGHLIAVPGKPEIVNATVFIKDGVIQGVVKDYSDRAVTPYPMAADAKFEHVDLRDMWVLPGLIDCHVHLTNQTSRDQRLRSISETDAYRAIDGVVYARRTVEAGFTTVRDVGASGDSIFALRDAINEGRIVGPRVLAAGSAISPTGGHGDPGNGVRRDIWSVISSTGVADGVDACREAVRTQVKRGADVIKLTATGGVLSNIGAGVEQQFFDDELRAICETSHLLNKKVAAHAHGVRGVNAALRAGVDSIEHGTYLDDESITLFKQTGAFYVPTITAGKSVAQFATMDGYYPTPVVAKALAVGPLIQDAFAKAWKGGVKIAFGTDAGVFPHGENAREFIYMTEAGMPAEQAIISATITAAELLGLSERIGTIESGKFGDLIATSADPRADITQLQRVQVVIRDGKTVHFAAN